MAKAPFKFDTAETFRHLSNPPIVEAIIHWQARGSKELDADSLRTTLTAALPEYITCDPIQQFTVEGRIDSSESQHVSRHLSEWYGLRLSTQDDKYIAQFTRDGVALSRRQPYQDWEEFSAEAKRVWHVYESLAEPIEVQRLGVRFINRIESATFDNLSEILQDPPTCPLGLPLNEFLYQSTFSVPGQPFGVRVIKMMQRVVEGQTQSSGLFLDFDIYTEKAVPRSDRDLDDCLTKMRWLKNKVFFDLLTGHAIELFL